MKKLTHGVKQQEDDTEDPHDGTTPSDFIRKKKKFK